MQFKRGFILSVLVLSTAIAGTSVARAGTVSGDVTYRERIAVPAGAQLAVELRDVSRADAPSTLIVAEHYDLVAVPMGYELGFDDALIDEANRYAVSARITLDGELLFITDTSHPVLTAGAKDTADMILKKVSGQVADPDHAGHLADTEWALVAVGDAPAVAEASGGIAFDAAGHFSGTAGCNRFSGMVEIDGDQIRFPDNIAGTMMACPPELDAQEQGFLEALSNAAHLRHDVDQLWILDSAGSVLLAFARVN